MKIKYIYNKFYKRVEDFKSHPLTKNYVSGDLFRYIRFKIQNPEYITG